MGSEALMRFDTKVIFIKKGEERYNPQIGGMEATETREIKYCS